MDKAIIIDVYGFVSFHVCKALLDKGISVKGIELDENVQFRDEKRLEVGRNANYEEIPFIDWTAKMKQEETQQILIFSLYDLYMFYNEAVLQKETITSPLLNYIMGHTRHTDKIVFLAPSQMLSRAADEKTLLELSNFLAKTNKLDNCIQFVYMPSVYGPWQPETFIFQHAIVSKFNRDKEFNGEREETTDALFIEDAVELVIEIIEKHDSGKYLLTSGMKNHWDQCAAYLEIDNNLPIRRKQEIIDDDLTVLSVKKATPISESIAKQIEHAERLYQ